MGYSPGGCKELDMTDHEQEHMQEIKCGRWNSLPYLSVCPRIVWPPRKTLPVQLPGPCIHSPHSLTKFFLVLLNLPPLHDVGDVLDLTGGVFFLCQQSLSPTAIIFINTGSPYLPLDLFYDTKTMTDIFTSCHFLQPLCSSGSPFLLNLFSVVLHQLQVTTEVSQEGKVIFSSLKTLCRLTCQKHVCPMFFHELFQHDRIS